VTRIEADYPPEARRLHQQGAVLLGLYINERGSLDRVEIVMSSGHRLLDEAAIAAIQRSRFRPAYEGNVPIPSRAEITVTFRLE
jgi:protein TonB